MRAGDAREFVDPPRTVCQMVGDSKRGGDVKRLNSEECIQHLQHLGRCAWRDEGRSRAHGVRIEVCHLTESEVPTSERKTGLYVPNVETAQLVQDERGWLRLAS